MALRSLAEAQPLSIDWIGLELDRDSLTYSYVTFGALLVLVLLGGIIGVKEDRLRSEAITDRLTGLFNRRHFERCLATEIARAVRRIEPLTLLLIDLDGLKTINDQNGHQAGDQALRAVASGLQRGSRSTDIVARIGGDEFALLAPHTSQQDAEKLGERLRAGIRSHSLPGRPLSASIGIAELSALDEPSGPALLEAADRALYTSKTGGRDRVSVAHPAVRSSPVDPTPFA